MPMTDEEMRRRLQAAGILPRPAATTEMERPATEEERGIARANAVAESMGMVNQIVAADRGARTMAAVTNALSDFGAIDQAVSQAARAQRVPGEEDPFAIPTYQPTPASGGGAPPRMVEQDILGPQQRAWYESGAAALAGVPQTQAERIQAQLARDAAASYAMQERLDAQDAGRRAAEADRDRAMQARLAAFDEEVARARDKVKITAAPDPVLVGMLSILGADKAAQAVVAAADQRLKTEMAAYNAQGDRLHGMQTAYAMARQSGLDAREAESTTRAALLQSYGEELRRHAAESKSIEAQNSADQVLATLKEKYAQDQMRFLHYGPSAGGGGAPSPKLPDLDPKTDMRLPDGSWVRAPSSEDRKALADRAESLGEVRASITRINQLRDELGYGTGVAGGGVARIKKMLGDVGLAPDRAAMEAALDAETSKLALALKKPGMNSDKDFDVLRSMVGDVRSSSAAGMRTADALLTDKGNELQRALRSGAYQRLQPVAVVNPRTGIKEIKVVPYAGTATKSGAEIATKMPGSFKPEK